MKAWKTIRNVLVILVAVLAVCMMLFTIVSVATFDRADRSLFGCRAFIVMSDSIKATDFASGDLIFMKQVDPDTLQPGDIIAYTSQNAESYGETITHKIRQRTTTEDGEPGFITYGTTTDTDDEAVVTYPAILGRYVRRLPGVGRFFLFLKTTPGYIVCILTPFVLLILLEGVHCMRLFAQYKKMQQAERDRLKAEREETQQMKQQLMEMMEKIGKLE